MVSTKSALVVIPTTGAPTLSNAVASVVNQNIDNVKCLVVIDGPEYTSTVMELIKPWPTVQTMVLPWNIGANGWYGHRTYYLSSALIEQDYWFALDQDNWFEPTHVQSMISHCEKNNWAWCHSLRKIFSPDGRYLCDDDCESLGRHPIYLSNDHHLVDTSSYCVRKDTFISVALAWYSGWGGDRRFYSTISQQEPRFGCTGQSTVCYRLAGNSNSVNADFFIKGNQIMKQRYPYGFPWRA